MPLDGLPASTAGIPRLRDPTRGPLDGAAHGSAGAGPRTLTPLYVSSLTLKGITMYRFAPWTLAAACTMAPGEPEVYSSDTGGPMESSLHTGADSGNSCADTWLDPDFVVVDGVVRPDPDVYPGMRLVLSYDIVGDRAVITLHAIRGTQQVGLGFTGDPYAHSGKFV